MSLAIPDVITVEGLAAAAKKPIVKGELFVKSSLYTPKTLYSCAMRTFLNTLESYAEESHRRDYQTRMQWSIEQVAILPDSEKMKPYTASLCRALQMGSHDVTAVRAAIRNNVSLRDSAAFNIFYPEEAAAGITLKGVTITCANSTEECIAVDSTPHDWSTRLAPLAYVLRNFAHKTYRGLDEDDYDPSLLSLTPEEQARRVVSLAKLGAFGAYHYHDDSLLPLAVSTANVDIVKLCFIAGKIDVFRCLQKSLRELCDSLDKPLAHTRCTCVGPEQGRKIPCDKEQARARMLQVQQVLDNNIPGFLGEYTRYHQTLVIDIDNQVKRRFLNNYW